MMFIVKILWTIFQPLLTTRIGVYVVMGVLIICASLYGGYHYRDIQAELEQKDAIELAIEEFEIQQLEDGKFIQYVETVKSIYIIKEIEVIREAAKTKLCADNQPTIDFRMLYNRAIRQANETPARKPDGDTSLIGRLVSGP